MTRSELLTCLAYFSIFGIACAAEGIGELSLWQFILLLAGFALYMWILNRAIGKAEEEEESMTIDRRAIGAQSKSKGAWFESLLNRAFALYSKEGRAMIEKTPEPMRVIRSLGGGRFEACFERQAQPDYKGVLANGQMVVFEAKYTSSDIIRQNRVTDTQAAYLDSYDKLGAWCFILVGMGTNVYRIPWKDWTTMHRRYGHKFMTESELEPYKVDGLRILD